MTTNWHKRVLAQAGPRLCTAPVKYSALKQILGESTNKAKFPPHVIYNEVKSILDDAPVFCGDIVFEIGQHLGVEQPDTINPYKVSRPLKVSHEILNVPPYRGFRRGDNRVDRRLSLEMIIRAERLSVAETLEVRAASIIEMNRSKFRTNPRKMIPIEMAQAMHSSHSEITEQREVDAEITFPDTTCETMCGQVARVDAVPRHVVSQPTMQRHGNAEDEILLRHIPPIAQTTSTEHVVYQELLEVVSLPADASFLTEELEHVAFHIVAMYGPEEEVISTLSREFRTPAALVRQACEARAQELSPVFSNQHLNSLGVKSQDQLVSLRYLFCSRCCIFDCRIHGFQRPLKRLDDDNASKMQPNATEGAQESLRHNVNEGLNGHHDAQDDYSSIGSEVIFLEEKEEDNKQEKGKEGVQHQEVTLDGVESFSREATRLFPHDSVRAQQLISLFKGDPIGFSHGNINSPSSSVIVKPVALKPGGDLDDNRALHRRVARMRMWREPCDHTGPCRDNPECECFSSSNFCEKDCGCVLKSCGNDFPGCRCVSTTPQGKCCSSRRDCRCKYYGRECIQGKCTCIGSMCVNQRLSKGEGGVKLAVGASEIHMGGMGTFAGEKISKGAYIGEYMGDFISEIEANARGFVYDHIVNISFLFQVCQGRVLDAQRRGNKTKWMNCAPNVRRYDDASSSSSESGAAHDIDSDRSVSSISDAPFTTKRKLKHPPSKSGAGTAISKSKAKKTKRRKMIKQKPPRLSVEEMLAQRRREAKFGKKLASNCYSRITFVEGEPHIAFFAKRDIEKGEELCFDYGRFRQALSSQNGATL